jgi:hypothetical protein
MSAPRVSAAQGRYLESLAAGLRRELADERHEHAKTEDALRDALDTFVCASEELPDEPYDAQQTVRCGINGCREALGEPRS